MNCSEHGVEGERTDEASVVLLRYDADQTIGYGHLSRCRSLGHYLRAKGRDVIHVLRHADQAAVDVLKDSEEQCIVVPDDVSLGDEALYIGDAIGGRSIEAAVLDISTCYNSGDTKSVNEYVESLGQSCTICLMDSVRDQELTTHLNARCDIVVVPYLGFPEPGPLPHVGAFLFGPAYFVFGPEYVHSGSIRREHPDVAKRILLTFGGSDPTAITLLSAQALALVDRELCVRVVMGPGLDQDIRRQVESVCGSLDHHVEIVESPSSLVDHMIWCDLAIANTGLTKYELALTGTPSIQISIDALHAEINGPFSKLGTSDHLGVHSDIGVETIAEAVNSVGGDPELRRRMSDTGRKIVDGRGGERIVTALFESSALNRGEVA